MRSKREIQDQLGEVDAVVCEGQGSKYPSMTYEEGVQAALLWVLEQSDDKPMDD